MNRRITGLHIREPRSLMMLYVLCESELDWQGKARSPQARRRHALKREMRGGLEWPQQQAIAHRGQ